MFSLSIMYIISTLRKYTTVLYIWNTFGDVCYLLILSAQEAPPPGEKYLSLANASWGLCKTECVGWRCVFSSLSFTFIASAFLSNHFHPLNQFAVTALLYQVLMIMIVKHFVHLCTQRHKLLHTLQTRKGSYILDPWCIRSGVFTCR